MVDIAGNKTVINIASDKLLIDTVVPTLSMVESVDGDGNIKNGLFGIGENINLKFTFSEILTLTDGEAQIGLDVITTPTISSADIQGIDNFTIVYEVIEGDSSGVLTFTGLALSTGNLRDDAGNDMIVFTADLGNSLENTSSVEVDGVRPDLFQVDSVYVVGENTVNGYWNSNSTKLVVAVGNSSTNFDLSLIGGNVQIVGRVYNADGLTAWQNIGPATVLSESVADGGGTEPEGEWNVGDLNAPYHYGQFPGKILHFEVEAADLEAMLEWPDESSAIPEQAINVDFTARITDKAGNDTLWDAGVTTLMIVDEVMPLDPAFGLPESGYNYSLASAFDNYEEIIAQADASGFSRTGYYNATNTGINFKSWIAFDDNRGDYGIDRDPTLIGGSVQVQMSNSADAATATWYSIGTPKSILQADVDAGFVDVLVSDSDIRAITELFTEDNTLYFRNLVTDVAGNDYRDSLQLALTQLSSIQRHTQMLALTIQENM